MGLPTQTGNATSGQWLLRRIRSILALGGIGTGALVIALAVAQPINPSWIQPLVGLLLFWAVMGFVAGWPIGLVAVPVSIMIVAKSNDDIGHLRAGREAKHHWNSAA